MFALITFKTPLKFATAFKEFYATANIKQVKILSMILFIIACSIRLITYTYLQETSTIKGYQEHSINNWFQISGSLLFYILSRFALINNSWNRRQKKIFTLSFVVFILLIAFIASYIISQHNTKNTLTLFLVGIVVVSLFFAVEYPDIIIISTTVVLMFLVGMVLPKLDFHEKILNLVAGFILGFILLCSSRYSYYFKSQHFTQLKELEQKNLEIERLNIQKGEILSFVAHDLRNPLSNIEALSTLLLMEDNGHNTEIKMIKSAAIQANEIIKDLIEVAKFDQSDLQAKQIEMVAYMRRIVKKWTLNSNREVLLNDNSTEIYANINPSRLERVIDNLISNGIKFSIEDKPIVIALSKREANICIMIEDFGIGIPEKLRPTIFNQFSEAGRLGLNGEKSIGLGLHISKRIIEQHGGRLLVSSAEGLGTAFTILLPIS